MKREYQSLIKLNIMSFKYHCNIVKLNSKSNLLSLKYNQITFLIHKWDQKLPPLFFPFMFNTHS